MSIPPNKKLMWSCNLLYSRRFQYPAHLVSSTAEVLWSVFLGLFQVPQGTQNVPHIFEAHNQSLDPPWVVLCSKCVHHSAIELLHAVKFNRKLDFTVFPATFIPPAACRGQLKILTSLVCHTVFSCNTKICSDHAIFSWLFQNKAFGKGFNAFSK